MNSYLVSIIIPVYNVEPYLHQCLDSVINQTYKNLEIILIDDGSTDKSGVICDEYKAKDKRIIVIHQKNQGLSAARNAGLDICKGEYISFIDSDDYVDLRFVEILLNIIIDSNSDIVAISSVLIDECGTYIKNDRNLSDTILENDKIYDISFYDNCVWNKIYKRSTINEVRFNLNSEPCEDAIFTQNVIKSVKKIICTSKKLYFYRKREHSLLYVNNNFDGIYKFVVSRYNYLMFVFSITKNKNVIVHNAFAYLLHLNSLVKQSEFRTFNSKKHIFTNFTKIVFKLFRYPNIKNLKLIFKIYYHYFINR